MQTLFRFLVDPIALGPISPLTLAFVAIMAALAAPTLLAEWGFHRSARRLVRAARESLGEGPFEIAHLHALGERLEAEGNATFAHHVREFAEGTHQRRLPDGQVVLCNAHQASDFLDAEDFRDAATGPWRWPPQLVDATPSLLTSLGILGTFIGLVLGLYLAQQGATPEAPLDIEGLIGGLSVSFLTSVFGLVASILVTFVSRAIDRTVVHDVGEVVTLLDRAVVRRTNQQILEDILHEQALARAAIQEMSTDLAQQMQEAMGQAVQTHLAPTFDRLARHTEEMKEATLALAQGSAERQVEGIGKLVDDFVGQMNGAIGASLEQASSELARFAALQAETTSVWDASISELGTVVRGLDGTTQRQEQAGRTFESALEAGRVVAEHFERGASTLAEAAPAIASLGESTRATVQSASSTLEALRTSQSEVLDATRDRSEALFEELGATTSSIAAAWSEETARLEGTIRGLVEALTTASSTLDTGSTRISDTVARTERIVSSAGGLLEEQLALQAAIARTGQASERQSEALREVASRMADATRTLDSQGSALAANLDAVSAVAVQNTETARTTLDAVQQIRSTLDHRLQEWNTTTEEMRRLHEVIATAVAQYAGQFPDQLKRNLEVFDQELGRAVGRLNENYGLLQRGAQELAESLESAVERIERRA